MDKKARSTLLLTIIGFIAVLNTVPGIAAVINIDIDPAGNWYKRTEFSFSAGPNPPLGSGIARSYLQQFIGTIDDYHAITSPYPFVPLEIMDDPTITEEVVMSYASTSLDLGGYTEVTANIEGEYFYKIDIEDNTGLLDGTTATLNFDYNLVVGNVAPDPANASTAAISRISILSFESLAELDKPEDERDITELFDDGLLLTLFNTNNIFELSGTAAIDYTFGVSDLWVVMYTFAQSNSILNEEDGITHSTTWAIADPVISFADPEIDATITKLLSPTPSLVVDGTPGPAAVPVPAAVWLFGTALLGLFGFSNRRKPA